MDLVSAVIAASKGADIVSCEGRRYTPEMLRPISVLAEHCVTFRSCGMSKAEKHGEWAEEAVV